MNVMNEENKYILSVSPLEDKLLKINLITGSTLILNMKNRLMTTRFAPLKNNQVFDSVSTDGYYIKFDYQPNYELNFTLREAVLMAVNVPPNTYSGLNPFEK